MSSDVYRYIVWYVHWLTANLKQVVMTSDNRINLYGELAKGKRPTGRLQLRSKDVCKWDLQALGINTDSWEITATDRDAWRHIVKVGLSQYEETQQLKAEEKRLHKKTACLASRPATAFTCSRCDRDCQSRIGLHSHNRRCKMGANLWSFETDRCQWSLLSNVAQLQIKSCDTMKKLCALCCS